MSRDKQIEKMAKDVCVNCTSDICASGRCAYQWDCPLSMETINTLHRKGYRKASDVAREIFEEIESKIATLEYKAKTPRKTVKVEELKAQVNWILHEVVPSTIAELKKKYESEDATTNAQI